MNKKELEFTVFCIENLAIHLNKNPSDIYNILKTSGIIDEYIIPLYDVLHTQSRVYIINDVINAARKRGVDL